MTNKEINETILALKIGYFKRTNQNLPEHAIVRPKFDCSKANDLTKAIVDTSIYLGHYARRISSEGRYRPGYKYKTPAGSRIGKGTWIPGLNKGIADIMITVNGSTVWIEVKIKDKQTAKQKEFEQEIKRAGGNYHIVRSFDQFLDLLKKYS